MPQNKQYHRSGVTRLNVAYFSQSRLLDCIPQPTKRNEIDREYEVNTASTTSLLRQLAS